MVLDESCPTCVNYIITLRKVPFEQLTDKERHCKAICIAKKGYDRELGCIKQYLFKIQLELINRNIFFF